MHMYFLLKHLVVEFSLSPDVVLIRWATFPVFLGIVTGAYEAIGCVSHSFPIGSQYLKQWSIFVCCKNNNILYNIFFLDITHRMQYGR